MVRAEEEETFVNSFSRPLCLVVCVTFAFTSEFG